MDRSVLGILAHTLDLELHWSEDNYGNIVVAFTLAYGIGYLVAGRVIDRIGAKMGYALFVFLWTLAAMAHAVVSSVLGFGVARFSLGFAESGNFPAAIRSITEWFPVEERALATGLFNSGSNAAALVAPFFIAAILARFHSWRYAFLGVGGLGLIWLIFWLAFPYDRLMRRDRQSDAHLDSNGCDTLRADAVAGLDAHAADVGSGGDQSDDRPGVVAVSILAAEISAGAISLERG